MTLCLVLLGQVVKDVSPTDIEKGPTGCTGYNEPEIMKNTSPLYIVNEG